MSDHQTMRPHAVASFLMVGFGVFWFQVFVRLVIVLAIYIHDPSVTAVHIPWIGLWSVER